MTDVDLAELLKESARILGSGKSYGILSGRSYGVLEKSTLEDRYASVLFLERESERISRLGLYHIHFFPEERAMYCGHLVDCGLNANSSLSDDTEEQGDYQEISVRWVNFSQSELEQQLAKMEKGIAQEVDFRSYLEKL